MASVNVAKMGSELPTISTTEIAEMSRHLCEACYATNNGSREKAALHAKILAELLIKHGVVQ